MKRRLFISAFAGVLALGMLSGCSTRKDNSTQISETSDGTKEVTKERTTQYYYDFGEINESTWVKDVKRLEISDNTLMILTDKTYENEAIKQLGEELKAAGCDYDVMMIKIPLDYTMTDKIDGFIKYIQDNGVNPDILCSVWGKITDSMPKDSIYDMTGYLSSGEGKKLKNAMDDTYWALTGEDGHWYGVGTVVESCPGWLVDRDTMLDLDLTVSDLAKPLEELEPVFEKIKTQKPELTPFVYGWSILETDVLVKIYDTNTYIGSWDDSGNVVNLLDDSRTYDFVKALNTYSEKGYAKMVYDMQSEDDYFMMAAWDVTPLMREDSLDMWSSPGGRILVKIPYNDMTGNVSIQSSVVLKKSGHIDQSLDFLSRINTTKEMSELILYGIENKDYISDGNTYQTDKDWAEMDLYNIPLGNLSICTNIEPFMDPGAKTVRSDVDRLNEKITAQNFIFDSSAVKDQYNAVTEKYSYLNNIYSLLDYDNHKVTDCSSWEEYYEKFNNELKEAGIEAVADEMNRQILNQQVTN